MCHLPFSFVTNFAYDNLKTEYVALGVFEESYVAACGVQQVVKRLSAPLEHIHLKTQITSIKSDPSSRHRYQIQDEKKTVV